MRRHEYEMLVKLMRDSRPTDIGSYGETKYEQGMYDMWWELIMLLGNQLSELNPSFDQERFSREILGDKDV